MIKVGLLSDTHGYLHNSIIDFFTECQEVWHAGDIGSLDVTKGLSRDRKLRAVFGNIDGAEIRNVFPEEHLFVVEGIKIYMIHIGGYPGKYAPHVREKIIAETPKLYISGHSHILKVQFDNKQDVLHINPGAAGRFGMHKVITAVRFVIDGEEIKDLEIIELQKR